MSEVTPQPVVDGIAIINGDRRSIAYRPALARLTGSVTSAILLQQIMFHWENNEREPFYKFKLPCDHEKYRPGDSWCEELAFTKAEFDSALIQIGSKIKRGLSKTVALNYSMPRLEDFQGYEPAYSEALELAIKHCVVFWTDSNRITWFTINADLLNTIIAAIYTPKSTFLTFLDKSRNRIYLDESGKPLYLSSSERNQRSRKEKDSLSQVASAPATAGDSPDLTKHLEEKAKATQIAQPQSELNSPKEKGSAEKEKGTTFTLTYSAAPPGIPEADRTVASSPASDATPAQTKVQPQDRSTNHAAGNGASVLPPAGFEWRGVAFVRHLVRAASADPLAALLCKLEYDGMVSTGPDLSSFVPCLTCIDYAEKHPPKAAARPAINNTLKDAIAEHVQGISPSLAGRLTGLLASMAAGVWKKRLNLDKLNAEQYAAVARSIPVFVEWYKLACPGCNLPQSLETFENWYSKFPPEWKSGAPVTQGNAEPLWVPDPEGAGMITPAQRRAKLARMEANHANQ